MSDIPTTSPSPAFRLLRVISVDSYSPGGEAILRVDGGAILTGDNGAGKTSLIRLIPVFFGELPRRISVGTESFGDFYLARTTSYIIFEYERRGVRCLAVLYAGSGGESYSYRFVRDTYRLELFTEPDGKTIIPGAALATHLKTLGVDHSRALSHDSYRAIIQGRVFAGRDAGAHRAYVADYAFTSSNSRLDHIDRIVSGMFRRQAEFRDFMRMVVSYISEKDDVIAISGDRGKIAVWPKQYAAYQAVMQLAPRMEDIEQIDVVLKENSHQLSVAHAKLKVLAEHATRQADHLKKAQSEAEDLLASEAGENRKEDERLGRDEIAARQDAEGTEQLLANLEAKNDSYQQDGLAEKAQQVESLPHLTMLRQEAESRHSIVLGAQVNINQRYEGLKQEVTRQLNSQVTRSFGEKSQIDFRYAALFEQHGEQKSAALGAVADEYAELLTLASNELQVHHGAVQVADYAANHPTPDPGLEINWRQKRTALQAAREALDNPAQRVQAATAADKAARAVFQKQDAAVIALQQRIDGLAGEISRLVAQSNPAPDSLLSFLRSESPDWSLDIAKVIDQTLLTRTDLSPALTEAYQSALYGVSLDLSRIDSPLVADEARLLEQIREIEARVREQGEQKTLEDAALVEAFGQMQRAEVLLQEAQQIHGAANAAVAVTESEERTLHAAMLDSQRINGADAKRRAAEARGREDDARKKLKDVNAARFAAEASVNLEFAAKHKHLSESKSGEIRLIDTRIANLTSEAGLRTAALDAERDAALTGEGVDVLVLGQIESDLKWLKAQISNAESWMSRVLEWRGWLERDWSAKEQLIRKAAASREKEGKLQKWRTEINAKWEAHRLASEERIAVIAKGAKDAAEIDESVATMIERRDLAVFPPDSEILKQPYDTAWTLDGLTAQLNRLAVERREAQVKLKTLIAEIKRAFRAGAGTPIEDYFQTTANAVDPDDENPSSWVTPLRVWYNSRHVEYLRPLLMEARKFGELIIGFQRDVERFGKQIRSFNIHMQNALDNTIVFERISSIKIHFGSTIGDKPYWVPITRFVQDHETWISGISNDLPSQSFANDLGQLLEHWDIREGIRADRLSLIDVSGEVVENGTEKRFRHGGEMGDLSSTGLSYLILIVIFVAFLRMIRGDADVRITYAVDELGDLDRRNVAILVDMLRRNNIDLVSACPDTDMEVLHHFPNRYQVTRNGNSPELVEVEPDDLWEVPHV